MFALGEGVQIPATVPGAPYLQGIIFVGGMAAYFAIYAYLLSRGEAPPHRWAIVVALNAPLIISVVIALVVEPNKEAVLPVAGVSVVGTLCSSATAALALRAIHP